MVMRVAIIGAGLTGLTAARALRAAGLAPVIFDKGRGLGGRLATRRAPGGLQFDHGAPHVTGGDPGFAALLDEAVAAGAARRVDAGNGTAVTGSPGMNALAKFIAGDLEFRRGVTVEELARRDRGWLVAGEWFDRVICTAPAPQAINLIGAAHPLAEPLRAVRMDPILTLMLALPPRDGQPEVQAPGPREDGIAKLIPDSEKHGRPGPECWVAHANPDWSRAHLEEDKESIARLMLGPVCHRLGVDPSQALHVAGHRWRYAQAETPLGTPFLADGGIFIGGDWTLPGRAEAAWQSGRAMARTLLETA